MPRSPYVPASDGLIARNNGAWATGKLSFLDEFGPPALLATRSKLQRYYLDLFAGPGINVDADGTGEEFEGSALRVLRMTAPNDSRIYFTHAELVNLDRRAHGALETRVKSIFERGEGRMPRKHVHLFHANTNLVIHRILRGIHPDAYVLAFADIESPNQWPWSTVRAFHAHGHTSIDLYLLFPLDMAINRMISYVREATEANSTALTAFFGGESWRPLADQRITDAQSPRLRRALLDLYVDQLRSQGWPYVFVVRDVRRRGQAGLYKMIFATHHQAGERIARWAAEQPARTNTQIGFDF